MSEIKKHIGGFDRTLARQLEEGADERGDARIDYAGPVPRVFYAPAPDGAARLKSISRGFWAARPGEKTGLLFGVQTVDEVTAVTLLDAGFEHCGATYVVGPVMTDFDKTGVSPDKYHDIWVVTAEGKAWLNGAPFPSKKKQFKLTGTRPLLFLRASMNSLQQLEYSKKRFISVTPYIVTDRRVGLGTIRLHENGAAISETVTQPPQASSFYSSIDGLDLADIAPGWEWKFDLAQGWLEAEAIRLSLMFKGARAVNIPATVDNLAPISTHQLEFLSEVGSYDYLNTGGAWATGYHTPVASVANEQVPVNIVLDLQYPKFCHQGHWSLTSALYVNPTPPGYCQGYQPVNFYRDIELNHTAVFTNTYVADLQLQDPTLGAPTVGVSTHVGSGGLSLAGQSFYVAPLELSDSRDGSGKQADYTAQTARYQWGASTTPGSTAPVEATAVIGIDTPPPTLSTIPWRSGRKTLVSNQIVRLTADSALASTAFGASWPTAVAPLNTYDPAGTIGSFAVTKRRSFDGLAWKSGYRSDHSVGLTSAFGELSRARVLVTYRYLKLSGTKFTYNDDFAVGDIYYEWYGEDATLNYGANARTTRVTVSASNSCPVNAAAQTSIEQAMEDRKGTVLSELAKRVLHYWPWNHDTKFIQSSVPHTQIDTSGERARYEMTTRDYLFLGADFKVWLDSALVKDFGAGADFDSSSGGTAESSLQMTLKVSYRDQELYNVVLFNDVLPEELLPFATRYQGLTDGWDDPDTPNPFYSHPKAAIRSPVTGIFPTYSMQECCPFVAYTTSAEIAGGAHAQCYFDIPVRLVTPQSFSEPSGEEVEVQFVPLQLLNNLTWMTAIWGGEYDNSPKAYAFFAKLHEQYFGGAPIVLRGYYTAVDGFSQDVLPPDLQARYGLSNVHFGRI